MSLFIPAEGAREQVQTPAWSQCRQAWHRCWLVFRRELHCCSDQEFADHSKENSRLNGSVTFQVLPHFLQAPAFDSTEQMRRTVPVALALGLLRNNHQAEMSCASVSAPVMNRTESKQRRRNLHEMTSACSDC